jgi:moderate conductance mechanosensitive channel
VTPILADHVDLASRDWLMSHGIRIALILVMTILVLWLARLAVRRMQRRMEGVETTTQELNLQRAATVTQALSYVIRVIVVTVALLLILGEFAINLGPLIAGAGIIGVALGFGAQTLVRDFLSGFFILLENQFGVGDVITVNVQGQLVTGKVEALSLRTTDIRSFDGTLHSVPNGNILYTGNKSKGWARAIVDVSVTYAENQDRVRGILEELFEELRSDEAFQGWFFDGPSLLGVERLGQYDVVFRVVAETRPSKKGDVERALRQRITQRFAERDIEIPTAPVVGGATPPV